MTLSDMLIGCLIMALVTYVTKAVGLLLVRKQIRNGPRITLSKAFRRTPWEVSDHE